ncbi:hypothetical protein [Bacillus sp. RS11]|uniref:hypothetical protein n=1 Tax=Lysinibacillus sp. RS11 TaxID=3242682 RepID=UPI0035C70CAB
MCESTVLTQRQQLMFFVRKRSANAATATDVFCAKALATATEVKHTHLQTLVAFRNDRQ